MLILCFFIHVWQKNKNSIFSTKEQLTLKVSFLYCISALECVGINKNFKSLINNWSAIWNWIDLFALIWWGSLTFKVDYSLVEKIEFLFFTRHRKKHKMLFVRERIREAPLGFYLLSTEWTLILFCSIFYGIWL